MSEICPNQLLEFFPGLLPVTGLVRILWIDHREMIRQSSPSTRQSGSRPWFVGILSMLVDAMDCQTKTSSMTADPRSLMTDEQLARLYPSRIENGRPYVLEFRDFWWPVIEAIAAESERIFCGLTSLNSLVSLYTPRRKSVGSVSTNWDGRYWASGSVRNALPPDSNRCGGPINQERTVSVNWADAIWRHPA